MPTVTVGYERQRPGSRPHGFTLTEVLVVVSIICILASLLAPSLNRAVWLSRQLQCSSNLKQINMISFSYQENNKGAFPVFSMTGGSGVTSWYDYLELNYSGRTAVEVCTIKGIYWWCPSSVWDSRAPVHAWRNTTKYGGNQHLSSNYRTIFSVRTPSKVMHIIDRARDTAGRYSLNIWATGKDSNFISWRHNFPEPATDFAGSVFGDANLLYVDGHVSPMNFSEFDDTRFRDLLWPERP